jgi:hypothetical protein
MVVGLVVLALAATTAYVLWPRGPRPCRETFEQVREGMTYDEVCATVGGPPGDYTDGRSLVYRVSVSMYRFPDRELWAAEDSTLIVDFEDDGRSYRVLVSDPVPVPRAPLLDRLRARVGL